MLPPTPLLTNSATKMGHTLFHVGVKALITDGNGRIALFKTHPWDDIDAYWDLPGGRIEDGQTVEDTLKREIEEETGITSVENIEFFSGCISNIQIPLKDGTKVGLVLMAYEVTVPEGATIQLSEEHTDYEWVTRTEAAERLKVKYPKDFTDALAV